MPIRNVVLLLLLVLVTAPSLRAAELSAASLDKRRKELVDLLDEEWQYALRTNPEFASASASSR
jgi:hypothetical protein